MSSSEFNRIYGSADRGFREAKGFLMPLYRKIIGDLGIGPHELVLLLEHYIHDPTRSGVPQTPKKRSQARGNYIKKLIGEEGMSIRSFVDLISMLRATRIQFIVRLTWEDMTETEHSYTRHFPRPTPLDQGDAERDDKNLKSSGDDEEDYVD